MVGTAWQAGSRCGRYAATSNRPSPLEQFVVDDKDADELKGPDYNIAPTKKAPVVIVRPASDAAEENPMRELRCSGGGFDRTCQVGAGHVSGSRAQVSATSTAGAMRRGVRVRP
jgi:hypothetical protein